jgi:uncharacterized protein (DUF2141 family)
MIKMKKYRVAAIVGLSLILLMCSRTKNPVMGPGEDSSGFKFKSLQSSCGEDSIDRVAQATKRDTVIFSAHGDTIFVTHQDAFYNCCSEIRVNVIQTADGFDLVEYDIGEACHCMCDFDISTVITGVSDGTYVISGIESSQSNCKGGRYKLDPGAVEEAFEESVVAWVHGDTIWVTHKNVYTNCCAEFKTEVEWTERGFDVYEYDFGFPCDCLCTFDITTTIYGVAPGTYVIRVFFGRLVDSVIVDVPGKYSGFASAQGDCKRGLHKVIGEVSSDTPEDSVLAWFGADTVWVMHKNALENCCSIIITRVRPAPGGFDLYEYDTATDWCNCVCYFDIVTTIYGVSPGVYVIRVFDTAGDPVAEVVLEIPFS